MTPTELATALRALGWVCIQPGPSTAEWLKGQRAFLDCVPYDSHRTQPWCHGWMTEAANGQRGLSLEGL